MSRKLHTTLILPCVHVPWQNKTLLNAIYRLSLDIRPDRLIIAGDFADLYTISRYNKNSLYKLKDWELGDEYDACNAELDNIDAAIKCKDRHYLWGNHEQRFVSWLEEGDNSKLGKALGSPQTALRLRERGFKVYTNWQDASVKVGTHLEVVHGVSTSVHADKKNMDEFEGSVAFAHTHRCQTFVWGKRGGYGLGFLGDRDCPGFQYMPLKDRRKWCNGFGVVYTLDDGGFLMNAIQCWNSRFVFGGKLY